MSKLGDAAIEPTTKKLKMDDGKSIQYSYKDLQKVIKKAISDAFLMEDKSLCDCVTEIKLAWG